jgi:phosphate/sulfate permease
MDWRCHTQNRQIIHLSKHHHHQVFTAIINSFTHGANDVANAMGPFSAVYFTWANNKVATKNPDIGGDMYWILALGTSHE